MMSRILITLFCIPLYIKEKIIFFKARYISPVQVGTIFKEGWSNELPLYLAYCKKHGYYSSAPHGWKNRTICWMCLNEQ